MYLQRGYLCRWIESARFHERVHRRVWEEANGPIPEGMVIHHVNGDKQDNRLENLALVTRELHPQLHRTKTKDDRAFCSDCETWQPLDQFYRARNKTTGRQAKCKSCSRSARAAWAAEHPDRIAEYEARRSSHAPSGALR